MKVTINTDLRRCPFCGKSPKSNVAGYAGSLIFTITCPECRLTMKREISYDDEFDNFIKIINQLVHAWNSRADNSVVERELLG